jgi:glycosyltransferase involved in cell wall biosynthesis
MTVTTPSPGPVRRDADRPSDPGAAPPVWIVARVFGASGQPWLWRQATKMSRLRPHVVCWDRRNAQTYPAGDVTVLPHEAAPYEGSSRWVHRLLNAPGGNFFAARGAERAALSALVERTRPGAILCHFGDIAMRLLPVARAHAMPLVAHFHGIQQNLDNYWFRKSLLATLPEFAAVVVVGSQEREWLLRYGVEPGRIHLIPCGAPADVFRPREQGRPGPVRFALASRLVDEKGVEYSIRAFALAARRLPGCELHLFGDGPLRARLESLVGAEGLRERVFFRGFLAENELSEQLPAFDVFVQHSLTMPDGWVEGFGVSVAEASASGLPVIVSACGGLLDQVIEGYNGIVVPQRDVRAMSDAMCALAADPALRERIGANGRQRVLQHYDSSGQIKRLEEVMLRAIAATAARVTGGATTR